MPQSIKVIIEAIDRLSQPLKAVGAGLKDLEQKLQGVAEGQRKWQSNWSATIAAAQQAGPILAGVGAGIGLLAKSSVGASMQMEGFQAQFRTAMKDGQKAAEMFDWAKKKAVETPFEMKDVVDASVRLQLYGESAKKWFGLVGDMAGAMNRNVTDAVEAVADALRGEFERMKEFGIKSSDLLKFGAKGRAGGVAAQTPEEQAAIATALQQVMAEKFGGGMAQMMQTTAGAMSNLSDAIYRVKTAFGDALVPVVRSAVPILIGIGDRFSELARTPLGSVLVQVGTAFGGVLLALGPFLYVLPQIVSGFRMAQAAFMAFISNPYAVAIGGILAILGVIIGDSLRAKAALDEARISRDKLAVDLGGTKGTGLGPERTEETRESKRYETVREGLRKRLEELREEQKIIRDINLAIYHGRYLVTGDPRVIEEFGGAAAQARRVKQWEENESTINHILAEMADANRMYEEVLKRTREVAAADAATPLPTPETDPKKIEAAQEANKAWIKQAEGWADAEDSAADTIDAANKRIDEATKRQGETQENNAERIQQANRAVTHAQQSMTDAVTQGARQVGEASTRLADLKEASARREADAAERVKDAEQKKADAVLALDERIKESSRDLARVRRDAEESVAEARKSAEERVRSAAERVQSAYVAMVKPPESEMDEEQKAAWSRWEKESTYQKAVRAYNEAVGEAAAAVAKAERAAKERVADAEERAKKAEDDARRRIAEADKAVTKAIGDAADARAASAKEIGRAQQAVIDAQTASNRAIADAQERVNEAIEARDRAVREARKAQIEADQAVEEAWDELAKAQTKAADTVRKSVDSLNEAVLKLNQSLMAIPLWLRGVSGLPGQAPPYLPGGTPGVSPPEAFSASVNAAAAQSVADAVREWTRGRGTALGNGPGGRTEVHLGLDPALVERKTAASVHRGISIQDRRSQALVEGAY